MIKLLNFQSVQKFCLISSEKHAEYFRNSTILISKIFGEKKILHLSNDNWPINPQYYRYIRCVDLPSNQSINQSIS
ncbi:hypothetical protein DERP_003085 [Dermatophagoides pteronyssinus]|uniref:Uncharacterized protein n=1 Tax=Dermatophagoides pteronyssinus TaxID=6956 RepID=A0ABQ8JIJ2_DERPT|nr:hypothetical protein DERP_003085 [Dermatophagoides pteronyssinus]